MKVVDITEKLNFDNSAVLRIKGRVVRVNADAPTMLKLMGKAQNMDDATPDEIIAMYELIFPKKSREELDRLKLSFSDLLVVIQEAITLVTDTGTEMGEAVAPAMT